VENVQDYPRPPRLDKVGLVLRVMLDGVEIARTNRGLRICETHHPPTYYFPPSDVLPGAVQRSDRRTYCEWKGGATYWNIVTDDLVVRNAAWSYPVPDAAFDPLRDHVAFYPERVDSCWVGTFRVQPQPGDFYGGWVTPNLTGLFKGGPGTRGW
jgi:uncharacterized protein (DUF427 family)